MSFLIVEPHADDAFLSLGGLIETWVKRGDAVTIMTVYSGDAGRREDAQAYAKAVGAAWYGVGLTGTNNARENGAAPCVFSPDNRSVILKMLAESIVMLPFGIGGHPEHIAVRDYFHEACGGAHTFFYTEQPYSSKLKNQEELTQRLQGKTIFYVHRPGARKYRHVKLFKHQAKFFHFNPAEELEMKGFELVVY